MARLNTRPSHAPSSRFASATPAPGTNSDQENADPSTIHQRVDKDKGKGRATMPPPQQRSRSSLPTPTSDSPDAGRGQKRKRGNMSMPAATQEDEDERKFTEYYDPNQDPEERREGKRKMRNLERDFNENRDGLLHGPEPLSGDGITITLNRANTLFLKVKQTGDATVDSRLLVNVTDLAYKKTAQLVQGDSSTGIDVDEFLSKCITFMRNGGPLPSEDHEAGAASRRRTGRRGGGEDSEDEGGGFEDEGGLDFEVLGRRACFVFNARPAVPSFLLGPLSVEKKVRKEIQRRAKQGKDTAGRETRPEALTKDDLQKSEENGLTQICTRIRAQLKNHVIEAGHQLVDVLGLAEDDLVTAYGKEMLRKHRLSENLGVPLFEFVVNPRSFGQTVENMFYVSFLIKEGSVAVKLDEEGLPTINIEEPPPKDGEDELGNPLSTPEKIKQKKAREKEKSKHQAVLALDFETWRGLVEAFEIRESMIPHRDESGIGASVGGRGWYT
ncbi:hypothetical protein LTR10_012000 [Elasticomyces elasticus]|nr:hypothetical protein LTR10_012000 [Elasticomyces elasticus]KAK4968942.1 hypothetical protein LTR42_009221 [Elasticomyces elasticus]